MTPRSGKQLRMLCAPSRSESLDRLDKEISVSSSKNRKTIQTTFFEGDLINDMF